MNEQVTTEENQPILQEMEETSELTSQDQSDFETSHIDKELEELAKLETEVKEKEKRLQEKEQKKADLAEAMSSDNFVSLLSSIEGVVAEMTQLNTLKFDEAKQKEAKKAYVALYEVIEDTPQLRFILNPMSKKMMNLATVGCFFIPLTFSVSRELKTRQQVVRREVNLTTTPINDNYFTEQAKNDAKAKAEAEAR